MDTDKRLLLSPEDRVRLEGWVADRNTPQKLVWRARIVLMWADVASLASIVRTLGKTKKTAYRWRDRYLEQGVDGLGRDATRPGRKKPLSAEVIARVVEMTLREKPPAAMERAHPRQGGWSEPHQRTAHLGGAWAQAPFDQDVQTVERQAVHREGDGRRRSLPMTHDYKRHGTTTLFAALDVATGRVIGECMKRHRHQEWLKFLRLIDRSTPKGFDLHLIADNYATHKHPAVKTWLAKHPRFHMHFTPTSASWLNPVERFFGLITGDRIRSGVFKSVAELEGAIQDYLDHHNADPKPFVWTKSATDILEKVARGRQALELQH
jgi:transposase